MLDTEKMESLRRKKGWTQAEVARAAKLPGKSYWNDVVSGRKKNITMDVLDNIAEALGVHARELIR